MLTTCFTVSEDESQRISALAREHKLTISGFARLRTRGTTDPSEPVAPPSAVSPGWESSPPFLNILN